MKISTKIIIGFLLIGILSVIISVESLIGAAEIQDIISPTFTYADLTTAAFESSSFAKRAEGHLMLYLTLDDEIDEEKFFLRHASLQNQIDILKTTSDENILAQVNLLQHSTNMMFDIGTQLLGLHNAHQNLIDLKENENLVREFHNYSSDARKQGVIIADLFAQKINQDVNTSSQQAQRTFELISMGVILLIIVISVISFWITKIVRETIQFEKKSIEIGKLAIIGELSSRLAHDIRNPLSVIQITFENH